MKLKLFVISLITLSFQIVFGQTWNQIADKPVSGSGGGGYFVIGNKLYICTGYYNGNYSKTVWEYDCLTNIWAQKNDFPGDARSGGVVGFSIGNKGYIGTGYSRIGIVSTYYKDFWEYDPATDIWTRKTDLPGEMRMFSVGFAIGDKGYIGTGTGTTGNGYLKDFWEYDPLTDNWTQKADFGGIERMAAFSFVINGNAYIGAGHDPYDNLLKDIWEYNPATDIWSSKNDFAGDAREDAASFSLNQKGYIGTGGTVIDMVSKDFWKYEPITDTWLRLSDFSGTDRHLSIGFSIADKGYIGMGMGVSMYSNYSDFWEFTPDSIATSIHEKTENLEVKIFPNPNTSVFTVNYKSPEHGMVILKIYNVLGECVYSKDFKSYSGEISEIVDLTKNGKGIYQLEIICGEKKSCKSIVVQ